MIVAVAQARGHHFSKPTALSIRLIAGGDVRPGNAIVVELPALPHLALGVV